MTLCTCPKCGTTNTFDAVALRLGPSSRFGCGACGHVFKPKPIKRGRTDAQRRSRDQEKKAERRFGGRRQPGSGSKKHAKGDVRDKGVFRLECKETTKKSYSIKLEELMKIEREASGEEAPLLEVSFTGGFPVKNYVIVPSDRYQALLEELRALRED